MTTEADLQNHLVIPGIAEFARGGLPDPPTTDDGNHWVDGICWLYCGQQRTRVLWIGPASVAGTQAPMYACGPCIQELQQRVWQSVLLDDGSARQAPPDVPDATPPPAGRRTGRHRGRSRPLRREQAQLLPGEENGQRP